jgi:hypothetical protein
MRDLRIVSDADIVLSYQTPISRFGRVQDPCIEQPLSRTTKVAPPTGVTLLLI